MQQSEECLLRLILPPGISKEIFPWGVNLIRDYVENSVITAHVEVLDLRLVDELERMDAEYGHMVRSLIFELKDPQAQIIGAGFNSIGLYYGLLAVLGSGFFELVEKNKLFRNKVMWAYFRRKYSGILDRFQTVFKQLLLEKMDLSSIGDKTKKVLWGITVYDNTIFNTLLIVELVRSKCPGAKIILGGDYLRPHYSLRLLDAIEGVSGIVIGYGESIITDVLKEYTEGTRPDDILLPGFLNRKVIEAAESTAELINKINCDLPEVPAYYFKVDADAAGRFVRREGAVIRIITQRGCSWGHCTFCNLIDRKKKHCLFPVSYIIKALEKEICCLESEENISEIKIVLDGDENSRETIISILDFCNNRPSSTPLHISFWFQTKICNAELGKVFARCNKHLTVFAMSNIESLNKKTLVRMKKGHTPLKGIYTCKLLMDTLPEWGTNYFGFYPLENHDDIIREVELLQKTLHLFMPHKCRLDVREYLPGECDDIFADREKLNLEVEQFPGDVWNREVFGVNIPFGRWVFDLTEKGNDKYQKRILKVLKQYTDAVKDLVYYSDLIQTCGKGKPLSIRLFFLTAIKMFRANLLRFWFRIIHVGIPNKNYVKKIKLLMYLLRIHLQYHSSDNNNTAKIPISTFYMQNRKLYKDYKTSGYKERWTEELNTAEAEILTYLYEIRSKRSLFDNFKSRMENREIEKIIDKHLMLGSVIESAGFYLCIANYPDYWNVDG